LDSVGDIQSSPAYDDRALIDQRADDLFDVEGVALGLARDQQPSRVWQAVDLEEVADQYLRLLVAQPLEHHLNEAIAEALARDRAAPLGGVVVTRPVRQHEEDPVFDAQPKQRLD